MAGSVTMKDTAQVADAMAPELGQGRVGGAFRLFGRRSDDVPHPPEAIASDEVPREFRRELTWYTYGTLFLLSVLAVATSYAFRPNLQMQDGVLVPVSRLADIGASVLKDMGVSGIIAIFLAVTFEKFSAREFDRVVRWERNQLKRDVFDYVYGYHVPEPIRKEIQTRVLNAKFVRDSIQLSYTLSPVRESNLVHQWMQVDLVVRYTVRNLTNVPTPYKLEAELEQPPISALDSSVEFSFLQIEGCRNPTPRMTAQELQERGFLISTPLTHLLKPEKPIVLPDVITTVTIGYRTVAHLEGGYDYFTFSDHTCFTQVLVQVPCNGFEVEIRDFGGRDLPTHDYWHHPEEGRYHWQHDRPILANQGVYIAWRKRNNQPPAGE